MPETNRFKDAYTLAQNYFKSLDFINARKWFEIAKLHPYYKDGSIYKLLQMDIHEEKYEDARKRLEEYRSINGFFFNQIAGFIGRSEYNFEISRTYYDSDLEKPRKRNRTLMEMAKLHIETGEYRGAQNILEELSYEPNHYMRATIELVCIAIYEGNYEDAFKLLNSVNITRLSPKTSRQYKILDVYLRTKLRMRSFIDSPFIPQDDYIIRRILHKSDRPVIDNIRMHTDQRARYGIGCFFKDTNAKDLLEEARSKIEDMNYVHNEVTDMYRFRLDRPIGFKGEEVTSDITVVTLIGTKDILTMYPIQLSRSYDLEGNLTSKELAFKRKGQK